MMTEKGTFIINGTEHIIVSQLVRSPASVRPLRRQGHRDTALRKVVTGHGASLEFDVDKHDTVGVRINRETSASPSPCCSRRWAGPRENAERFGFSGVVMASTLRERQHRRPRRGAAGHLPRLQPGGPHPAEESARALLATCLRGQALRPGPLRVGYKGCAEKLTACSVRGEPTSSSSTLDRADIAPTIEYLVRLPGPDDDHRARSASRCQSRSTTSTTSATVGCARSAS